MVATVSDVWYVEYVFAPGHPELPSIDRSSLHRSVQLQATDAHLLASFQLCLLTLHRFAARSTRFVIPLAALHSVHDVGTHLTPSIEPTRPEPKANMTLQQPFFGAMGCTVAIVFTCMGAAYGTAKSGVGIAAMGVLRPDLIVKSTNAARSADAIAFAPTHRK
jgi:hypothetical protein